MDDVTPFFFGLLIGIIVTVVLAVMWQLFMEPEHFLLYYTGLPDNPTCHMTANLNWWDCERLG